MKYLHRTIGLMLTLESNSGHIIKWWVDEAFVVHPDMKIHTGVILGLGKGSTYDASL